MGESNGLVELGAESNSSSRGVSKAYTRFKSLPILVQFTVLFVGMTCVSFLPLAIYGKSFFCTYDALPQQLNIFIDVGTTVRKAIKGVLAGDGFTLPAYDLSVGYGAPRTIVYDPLVYLSVLFPVKYAEIGFNVMVILRLWLSGASFLYLARELGFARGAALLAAFVYSFSSYGAQIVIQSMFLNYLIITPFVLVGAIRILRGRGIWLYSVSSAAMVYVLGITALYMTQLALLVFIIVHLISSKANARRWLKLLLLFIGGLAIAVALSAPVAIGNLVLLLGMGRLSVDYYLPLLYPIQEFEQIFVGFLGIVGGDRDWLFGYGALAIVSCAMLFSRKGGDYRSLKPLFILYTIFALVPFFGHVFNGFAYYCNRWIFAYDLLIACIVGYTVSDKYEMRANDARRALGFLGGYTLLVLLMPLGWSSMAFIQLVIAWILLFVSFQAHGLIKTGRSPRFHRHVFSGVALAAIAVNLFLFLSPYGANRIALIVDTGEGVDEILFDSPLNLVKKQKEEGLYRYDKSTSATWVSLNSSRLLDVYGIDFYDSMYNNDVDRFHGELAVEDTSIAHSYGGLGGRPELMELFGVKYYLDRKHSDSPIPYGLNEKALRSSDGYSLYSFDNPVPIASIFGETIDRSTYEGLTPLQKQEALLQGVIIDSGDASFKPRITSESLEYTVEAGDGAKITEKGISVRQAGSKVTLSFERKPATETYLYFRDLNLNAYSPRERLTESQWGKLSQSEKMGIVRSDVIWTPPGSFNVTVSREERVISGATCYTPASHLFGGHDTWLMDLGYSEEGMDSVTVAFDQPGLYTYDTFEVLSQPMTTLDEAKVKLASNQVVNLKYHEDTIECDATSLEESVLFLSVPYDAGWKATVNGEPVDVLKANTAFMAIELPQGDSEVVFSYQRTDLPLRCAACATCVLLVVAYLVMRASRRGGKSD